MLNYLFLNMENVLQQIIQTRKFTKETNFPFTLLNSSKRVEKIIVEVTESSFY